MRGLRAILVAAVVVGGLAGCTSSPHASATHTPALSKTFATFDGAESGRVFLELCQASGDDSIVVRITGSRRTFRGELGPSTMSFDGKDSIYTIDKTGALPQFATDRRSVTLDGVTLRSASDPSLVLSFAGHLSCPA